MKRQLYQCLNAKGLDDIIYCSEGHSFGKREQISILRLARGEPLIFTVCQDCEDYSEMGEFVLKEDRGWLPA